MKKVFIFILFILIIPSVCLADFGLIVLYNSKGKIVNTHYNAPGGDSPNVIITVDLVMEDGTYVKCIDTYMSGSAFLGFGRVGSPSSIKFIPDEKTECIRIK